MRGGGEEEGEEERDGVSMNSNTQRVLAKAKAEDSARRGSSISRYIVLQKNTILLATSLFCLIT